jgi:hypothetical protein
MCHCYYHWYGSYWGYNPGYSYYTGFSYPSYFYAAYPAYYYSPVYFGGAFLAPPRGEYRFGNCITIC